VKFCLRRDYVSCKNRRTPVSEVRRRPGSVVRESRSSRISPEFLLSWQDFPKGAGVAITTTDYSPRSTQRSQRRNWETRSTSAWTRSDLNDKLLVPKPPSGGVPCPGSGGRWGRNQRHGESQSRFRPQQISLVRAAVSILPAGGMGAARLHVCDFFSSRHRTGAQIRSAHKLHGRCIRYLWLQLRRAEKYLRTGVCLSFDIPPQPAEVG
jgi:hypothetical protein